MVVANVDIPALKTRHPLGDVLDFIRESEGLSLPEAIARLDGSSGLAPRTAHRPAGPRRTQDAALAHRDPALLTAAARFYTGRLRRLHKRRIRRVQLVRRLHYRRIANVIYGRS